MSHERDDRIAAITDIVMRVLKDYAPDIGSTDRRDIAVAIIARLGSSAVLPVGDDTPSLRDAIEPFAQAAANEASRVHLEDGYFTGPSGLTVGDWRQLAAAIADYDAAARPSPADPSGEPPLADAMYECCIEPPRTDHTDHVIEALRRNGWELRAAADPSPTTSREGLDPDDLSFRMNREALAAAIDRPFSGIVHKAVILDIRIARWFLSTIERAASPSPQPDPVGLREALTNALDEGGWQTPEPGTTSNRYRDPEAAREAHIAAILVALSSQEPTPAEPLRQPITATQDPKIVHPGPHCGCIYDDPARWGERFDAALTEVSRVR